MVNEANIATNASINKTTGGRRMKSGATTLNTKRTNEYRLLCRNSGNLANPQNRGLYRLFLIILACFSTLKPAALDTDFYTPFQIRLLSTDAYSHAHAQFHIVATEDNTNVQITPTANIVGTNAGVTKSVTLNRGKTFAVRTAVFLQAAGVAASHIVSDKPLPGNLWWYDSRLITN